MRVFVTGGAGFIGRAIVRQLRARGDDVTAAVRDRARASSINALGAHLVETDLGTVAGVRDAMRGCDAVIHLAASYRVGIMPSERPAMYEANVAVMARVLDAAIELAIPRIVAVTTVNVFGNTNGQLVNETYRRDPTEGFLSYYDETKFLAHRLAEARIADGAPILIAMPGVTYGPGDHTPIGAQLKAAFDGTARMITGGDMGISAVYVEDLASGILAVLDHGRIGEAKADLMAAVARSSSTLTSRTYHSSAASKVGRSISVRSATLSVALSPSGAATRPKSWHPPPGVHRLRPAPGSGSDGGSDGHT